MAPNPSMVVRIAGTLTELRAALKEGRDEIVTTTAGMQKLASSFSGDRIIQQAHNVVAAVQEVGGATKLTDAEQARVNATLERAIDKFKALGQEAPKAMIALAKETQSAETVLSQLDQYGVQQLDRFGQSANQAGPHVGTLRAQVSQFDNVLQAMGVNVMPVTKGLDDIASAAGKTTTQIGFVGTAGLALAAGYGGWQLGRMIADWTGLDKSIEGAWRQLLNYGDRAGQVAGAQQDVINRAIAMGADEHIRYKDAIQFVIDAQKRDADAKIDWRQKLVDAHRELRNLSDATKQQIAVDTEAGATTEQLSNKYHISTLGLKLLEDQQRKTAQATKEHEAAARALDAAYDKLMSDTKNANQLAIMEADAAKMAQAAQDKRQQTALKLRDAIYESARASNEHIKVDQALSAEQARIDAENQALMESYKGAAAAADEGGKVTKSAADGSAKAFAGVAAQVTITGDAIKEYIRLMQYSAQVNAILSQNSLFTTQSQRDRIAKIGLPSLEPRAAGGPVVAGRDYVVGERGPERFTAPASGFIIPNGGGGSSIVVQIAPGAIVQNFPITADPVAKQLLVQQLGDVMVESLHKAGVS